MKFLSFNSQEGPGLAVEQNGVFVGLVGNQANFPGALAALIAAGEDALARAGETLTVHGVPVDLDAVTILPPLLPGRILCVGLNYADHAAEAAMAIPDAPTLFSRFASTVVGPRDPIRLPRVSSELDFEGELAVVIGRLGRYIAKADALNHVAGYAVFNDASIRDYQLRTSQWTIGKNFDGTGPFGPVLVTTDALPRAGSGLAIQTRLNGAIVQSSNTDKLIFDVPTLISMISEAMTLEPGDVIITGTPAGVGNARTPKLFMRADDLCEVEIEGIGTLSNRIVADA